MKPKTVLQWHEHAFLQWSRRGCLVEHPDAGLRVRVSA